jgi:DNA-binding LytR/AlgR family response regulator
MRRNGVTGMEAAEKVYRADLDAAVIFTTVSEEHILGGYSYAVFYIVKPVDYIKLAEGLTKCRTQIERYAKTIEIIVERRSEQIRLRDILYVESNLRTCVFTCQSGTYRTNVKLSTIEEQLGGFPFTRCHKSFIVNTLHAADMSDNQFVMKNGMSVPISKPYFSAASKVFREYLRNRIRGNAI